MIRNRFNQPEYDSELGCFTDSRFHCKGGGGGSSTTTTAPSPEQRAILQKQLDLANRLEQQGELQFFPGQTLAGEDPLIAQAQQQALGGAGLLGGLSPEVVGAAQRGLNLDLVSDPRTEALAQAVTRPLEQRFFEQTLPQISSAAVSQGAFGGDRQQVLQAQAARDFTQNVGDLRAKVFSDALAQGLGQQRAVLGLLPQVQQGVLAPAQVTGEVGLQRQDREQQEIEAARERFEFEQFAPTDLANRVGSLLSSLNFGTVTTSRQSGGGK